MSPSRRPPNSWTTVRLPKEPLGEAVRRFAAPMLDELGADAPAEAVRRVFELAVNVWNAHVLAAKHWHRADPKPLAALRRAVSDNQATPGLEGAFERLAQRWRADFLFDPRLVAAWSLKEAGPGGHTIVCEMALPNGVQVQQEPPAEARIAIGGRFLDEVRIRQDASSLLSFPVEHHRGQVASDGVTTIRTKMPTAVELFAEGLLAPIGGTPVSVMVDGKRLDGMVLAEVHCTGYGGHLDVAVLIFRPA